MKAIKPVTKKFSLEDAVEEAAFFCEAVRLETCHYCGGEICTYRMPDPLPDDEWCMVCDRSHPYVDREGALSLAPISDEAGALGIVEGTTSDTKENQ